jgi:transcriptional regulator with XRE-family HTH domain
MHTVNEGKVLQASLSECLAALRLAPKEAAELLSVDPKTVARWLRGEIAVPGPAKQALRAWLRLDRLGLPWRPAEQMIDLTEEELADQIRLLRERSIGLDEILRRVRERGGPAAPWKVDLLHRVAELGDTMEVGFYPLPNGGFSPSKYRRKDREPDFRRDRALIDDAVAAIADAIAAAGPGWAHGRPPEPSPDVSLAEAIRRRFAPFGGIELAAHPPVAAPEPPSFEQ